MAFLAPALRWPDALGIESRAAWMTGVQSRMPAPVSTLSPDLFFSLLLSFTVIVVFTLVTTALQARHPQKAVSGKVHAQAGQRRRLKPSETPTALLAGPSGVGKTSVFSALAFNSVPSVHPSQRESESLVSVSLPPSSASKELSIAPDQRNVLVVDTPGHARIKDRIIGDYIKQTDVVIFCLDAKEALRGGAGLGVAKEGSLIEAVDHLHQLLIQLAKSRRGTKTPPPTLVVLFTRADLSPHLANVSLSSLSVEESKRRAILLNRARTAVEVELGRRRGGMGYGSRRTTKVGGMEKVTGASAGASTSLWASLKGLLGLGSNAGASSHDDNGDEDEDEELVDYVDWDVLERTMNSPSKNGIGLPAGTSLERLDADIVVDGRAICAFASVGKERGWEERQVDGLDEVRRILIGA